MSIVSDYATPEAKAALQRQRRNATLSSIAIAVLSVLLLALILALILLPGIFFETPTIVTYNAGLQEEEKPNAAQVTVGSARYVQFATDLVPGSHIFLLRRS